jgi:hypothetical protein
LGDAPLRRNRGHNDATCHPQFTYRGIWSQRYTIAGGPPGEKRYTVWVDVANISDICCRCYHRSE